MFTPSLERRTISFIPKSLGRRAATVVTYHCFSVQIAESYSFSTLQCQKTKYICVRHLSQACQITEITESDINSTLLCHRTEIAVSKDNRLPCQRTNDYCVKEKPITVSKNSNYCVKRQAITCLLYTSPSPRDS